MDIEFVEPNDARLGEVNETNCFNSTDIGFSDVYTITVKPVGNITSGAESRLRTTTTALRHFGWLPVALGGLMVLL